MPVLHGFGRQGAGWIGDGVAKGWFFNGITNGKSSVSS